MGDLADEARVIQENAVPDSGVAASWVDEVTIERWWQYIFRHPVLLNQHGKPTCAQPGTVVTVQVDGESQLRQLDYALPSTGEFRVDPDTDNGRALHGARVGNRIPLGRWFGNGEEPITVWAHVVSLDLHPTAPYRNVAPGEQPCDPINWANLQRKTTNGYRQ